MIYFDTAYLVKLYLPERGFAEVRWLLNEYHVVYSCDFARIEFVSSIRRAVREGKLPASALSTVFRQFDIDEQNGLISWLPISTGLVQSTVLSLAQLDAQLYLRAADALHLTCCRAHRCSALYTNDRHLLAAANAFGVVSKNVIPKTQVEV